MPHDLDSQFYVKQTKDMVNIVQRLVADGKGWRNNSRLLHSTPTIPSPVESSLHPESSQAGMHRKETPYLLLSSWIILVLSLYHY
ncbi:hypothetical protein J6590_035221 [Homalodisca vitripennis]|nr:hypothetical protein J6590_035221 [Homalodisca vitripennis]